VKATRDRIAVESTLVGEDIRMEMSQDAGDQAHLQSIMIDMYEDPIKAVVREYATNARDAHLEAGFAGAIEVSLPSALQPSFRVRDYGTGLSVEEIRDLYSKYGKSTKRGTNAAVGMLGIGCKSALTYSDQFSVLSVKDGRKVVVSVSRDEAGGGTMTVLEDELSDEANGTEIVVPVARDDHGDFTSAADHIFRFWPEDSVTVNGVPPVWVGDDEDVYELEPGELYVTTDEENDWVVMGGVPYPADLGCYKREKHIYGRSRVTERQVVAFVPIGEVHFTPSRESLQQTKRTQDALDRLKVKFTAAASAAIERDVQAADSKSAAFLAYWRAVDALNLRADPPVASYQGEPIPKWIKYEDADDKVAQSSYRYRGANSETATASQIRMVPNGVASYGYKNENRIHNSLGPDQLESPIIWVVNFAPEKFSADQRRRLDTYRDYKGITPNHKYALVKRSHVPKKDWINADNIWDWTELRKWRDPRAPKSPAQPKRPTGSYWVRSKDHTYVSDMAAPDLPGEHLYWVEAPKHHAGGRANQLIKEIDEDAVLVILPSTRVEKFKRDFPYAIPFELAHEAKAFAEWDKLTDREKLLIDWDGTRWESELSPLDPDKVDDPELAEVIRLIAENHKRAPAHNFCAKYREELPMPTSKLSALSDDEIVKRYPLLDTLRWYGPSRKDATVKHFILYLNAAYADKGGSA
jgi:hypothetical protein